MVRKAHWISALAGVLVLVGSVNGLAIVVPLVMVSNEPSPLEICSTPKGFHGKNYVSGEEEPQLAVFGSNMIAMWHQDRWSNGGAHGIGVGVSTDGGTTWNQSTFPANFCTTPTTSPFQVYERNSDPWVSFGPDGTAYASVLSFNVSNNLNAVVAGRSKDGGVTWDFVGEIPGSVYSTFQNSTDKNATTADPKIKGTAYTVWDTLILATDQPDDNPHTQAYTGPTYFSKTTNWGETWTKAKIILDTKERQQTIGNIIVVDPTNGDLYDFTDLIESPNTPFRGTNSNAQLAFVKSTDAGEHWTAPQVVAPFNSLGVIDPNTGQRLRVGDGLEEVAIDKNGKIYVVWESSTNYDKNVNQSAGFWDDEILLMRSDDHGANWNGPYVVHTASGLPTYTPTVAVNADASVVAVTYYDNSNLQPGQTANLPTDYWVSYSTNGGTSFGKPVHIAGPFDQLTAPYARGFFLGDYEGLQPNATGGFQALFVKTNCDLNSSGTPATPGDPACKPANYTGRVPQSSNTNPTDVFTATLTP